MSTSTEAHCSEKWSRMSLTPTFHGHRAFHLAGIRRWHTFATAPQTIPDQWDDFNALTLPHRAEATETFGATCQMDMPNQRFEYLAGYEVEDFSELPDDIGRISIPRAHYAVFALSTVSEIPPFWQEFFKVWLPTSGYKLAHTPDFERYDERFNPVTRGPLEIWIPIEPQS
jgi:AraC family transcriptional regulator